MSKRIRLVLAALVASIGLFAGLLQPSASLSKGHPFSAPSSCPLCIRGELFGQGASRRAQRPSASANAARNAALVAATETVLKETSEIRQLSIMRPVHSSTQSRAEIERMIIKNLDEEVTPSDLHADEVTLKKLGLAPADFQYRAMMIRLLTEQVAGYYDPKTREFHLADWIDLDGQKPIMAHELTHALQDQHFNLRRFEPWPKGDSDAELAAHSLIEGDATLTMMLYVANDPMRALAFLKSLGANGLSSAELEKAPRALRETLLFPYQEGTDWTRTLYKQGGWERVSKAFTGLPQSTEQILHPDKYFAREAPVKVTLPDIAPLLNAGNASATSGRWAVGSGQWAVGGGRKSVSSEQWAVSSGQWAVGGGQKSVSSEQWAVSSTQLSAGSADILSALSGTGVPPVNGYAVGRSADISPAFGYSSLLTHHSSLSFSLASSLQPLASWRRIDYDVNGEWGFYLILDQFLKSPGESRRAAAGWGGDRYEVYEGPKGEVLIASLSTWDTERDAREFFDAYIKRTALRYPGAERVDSPASSLQPLASSFRTSEGTVVIDIRGTRVLVLEGIPDKINSNVLAKSLWQ
jgi:hypothetical protein